MESGEGGSAPEPFTAGIVSQPGPFSYLLIPERLRGRGCGGGFLSDLHGPLGTISKHP